MEELTIKDKKIIIDLNSLTSVQGELTKDDINLEIHLYDSNNTLLHSFQQTDDWELLDIAKSDSKPINEKVIDDDIISEQQNRE